MQLREDEIVELRRFFFFLVIFGIVARHSYSAFYPEGPKNSESLARIVGVSHAKRIKNLLENTRGTIVLGGETDVDNKYIAPTIVKDVDGDDSLMSE